MTTRFIERPRITDKLATFFEHPLTLIAAPPGFGKTTALRQALAAQKRRFVYHGLRASGEPLVVFFQGLTSALADALGVSLPAFASGAAPPPAADLAFWLDSRLAGARLIIALDDVHQISHDGAALAWLCAAIEETRASVHWVLATRLVAHLPASEWIARGFLGDVVTETDLVFDRGELTTLVAERIERLPGSRDQCVANVESLTHGWPAATTLAVQCMAVAPIDEAGTRARGFLYQYLAQQAFTRLDAGAQRFLMQTCILPEVTHEAASALAGSDAGTIAEHVRSNLAFVIDGSVGFRYHDLYRGFLIEELRRRSEDAYRDTAIKTARWLSEQADLQSATAGVELLLEVDAFEDLAQVLPRLWLRLLRRGYISLLARCSVHSNPFAPCVRDTIDARIAAFLHRDRSAAAAKAAQALATLATADPATQCAVLTSFVMLIEAGGEYVTLYPAYFDACRLYLENEANLENPSPDELMVAIAFVAGTTMGHYTGDVGRIVERVEAAANNAKLAPDIRLLAMCRTAWLGLLMNERRLAQYIRDAFSFARENGLTIEVGHYNYLFMVECFAFDDIDAADAACAAMYDAAVSAGYVKMQREALAQRCSFAADRGDEVAFLHFEGLIEKLARGEYAVLDDFVLRNERPRLAAWEGDFEKAYRLQKAVVPPSFYVEMRWQWASDCALYAAFTGRPREAREHLAGVLPALLDGLRAPKWWRLNALAGWTAALAYLGLRKPSVAHDIVRALEASASGFSPRINLLVAALRALCDVSADPSSEGRRAAFERALAKLHENNAGGYARVLDQAARHIERTPVALTPAELQILVLAAQGLSAREMAERMSKSRQTVNAQVQSIFRKLSVRGRREAVARAKSLGLL